jgi:hypothetical protein
MRDGKTVLDCDHPANNGVAAMRRKFE